MTRYRAVRPITLPNPDDPHNQRAATRYLRGDVFDADPPTREMTSPATGKHPVDWLVWAEAMGVIIRTDEPTTGPGRPEGAAYPAEPRLREDGTYSEPEPSTEVIED